MKKWLLGIIVFMGIISLVSAQELLINGNFNDGLNGWTHYALMGSSAEGQAEVADDGEGPAYGSGPYLWMAGVTTGYMNQCVWQAVTVNAGDTLRADGAFRDLSGGIMVQYWMELYIGLSEPADDADYLDNKLFGFSEWENPPCANNIDGMFQTDACVNNTTNGVWVVPDTLGTDVTVYFVIKTGIWQDGSLGELIYEVAVDTLSLYSLNAPSAVRSKPISMPGEFTLYPNYPNPFNPSTTIRFEMPGRADMALSIYDINGRQIRDLMQETLNAGTYSVTWDGRDSRGNIQPSGVYLFRLQSGSHSKTQRLILMK